MKRWTRILLPLMVLMAGLGVGSVLIATGPKARRHQPPPVVPVVETLTVVPENFHVKVHSWGTVLPRTQSTLIPEVPGRVMWIAPNLRSGGFFEQGEALLTIDPADYKDAVIIANAELARARLLLAQEKAQAAQARHDWELLELNGEPAELLLHRPQLVSARADRAAAEARLHQAESNLARTRLRAPYAGRVLSKQVDVGQYVSPGTVLAKVYAVDYVEIRLPLTDDQLGFVALPEQYRGETSEPSPHSGPAVTLTARIGRDVYSWQGRVVRSDGAIDSKSRQLFVVAQVDDPYSRHGDSPPLKVGQFVEAEIAGRTLSAVFILPRSALQTGDQVLVISRDQRIERRPVEVVWQDGDRVVVSAGLNAGERISLTPMPFAADGTSVRLVDEGTPVVRRPLMPRRVEG